MNPRPSPAVALMAELLAEELSAHGIAIIGRSTCEMIIAAVIQRAAEAAPLARRQSR
jgi:hypothetical protein